jgi:hypothetical protein
MHRLWIFFILLALLAPMGAIAQDTLPAEEVPEHLTDHKTSAARNMLYQIFGSIAQVAGGELEMSAITGKASLEEGEINAEGIIAILMNYLNLAILGGLSVLAFLTINLFILQSGIDGDAFSKRYTAWSAVRVGISIITIMPVLGGWSVGQYGTVSMVLFGSDTADEMTAHATKFMMAGGTVRPIPTDTTKIRGIVRSIYASELCKSVTNMTIDLRHEALVRDLQEKKLRIEDKAYTQEIYDEQLEPKTQEMILELQGGKVFYSENPNSEINAGGKWSLSQNRTPMCGFTDTSYKAYILAIDDSPNNFQEGLLIDSRADNIPENIKNAINNLYKAHSEAIKTATESISSQVAQAENLVRDAYAKGYSSAKDNDGDGILSAQEVNAARDAAWNELADSLGDTPQLAFLIRSLNILNIPVKKSGLFSTRSSSSYRQGIGTHVSSYKLVLLDKFTFERGRVAKIIAQQQSDFNASQLLASEQSINLGTGGTSVSGYQIFTGDSVSTGSAGAQALSSGKSPGDGMQVLLDTSSKGWLFLGYRWWDISRSSAYLSEISLVYPKANDFIPYMKNHPNTEVQKNLYMLAERLISNANASARNDNAVADVALSSDFGSPEQIRALLESNNGNFGASAKSFMQGIRVNSNSAGWNFNFQTSDMLTELQEVGHFFLSTAAVLQAAESTLKAVEVIGKSLQKVDPGPLVNVFGGVAKTTINVIGVVVESGAKFLIEHIVPIKIYFLVAGFILAVYLPMLPAIFWTFSIIGWIQHVMEALMAMPLWGGANAMPESSGLTSQHASNGWKILIVIAATPPILVISMFLSMIMLGAIGFVLQEVWTVFIPSTSLQGSTGLDFTAIVGGNMATLMMYAVFIVLVVAVVHRVLAFIPEAPERIGLYIGGGAASIGADKGAGDAKGAFVSVQGQAQSAMAGKAPKDKGNPNHKMGG